MNLGSFAIISFFEKEGRGVSFSDYRGLAAKHPLMAAVLSLFMLALAGFPPTAGFVAKYAVFSSALEQGYVWLVVFAVLNSLVSVYYYIRIIVNMYMVEEEETIASHVTPMNAILLTFLAGIVILFGIYPSWLIDISIKAASVFS
jgi:NADH-quinone oxidoreductase subunit N